MNPTVLITGATGGIGLEFAKKFAKQSYDLILVSRDINRLSEIADEITREFGVAATPIAKDLSKPGTAQELFDETEGRNIRIDVLVNNAGAGLNGNFIENELDDELAVLQLNSVSVAVLCHMFGKAMAKRGSGRILNVSSTAAFQPGPLMANYYASKSYVLLLSEALRSELKPRGVTVTALCPGPTQTRLFDHSNMKSSLMARVPYILSAKQVAEYGYRALIRGKGMVVVGSVNRILTFSTRLAPRLLLAGIARLLNVKRPA